MMLADSFFDSAPVQMAIWLTCLMCLLVIVNAGFTFFRNVFRQGVPPNEQLNAALLELTKRLDAHIATNHQEHRDMFAKISGVERGAQAKLESAINSGNVSREALHKRINDLLAAISRLEGKIDR